MSKINSVLEFIENLLDENGSIESIEYDSYGARSDTTGQTGVMFDITIDDGKGRQFTFGLFREDISSDEYNDRLLFIEDDNRERIYTEGDEVDSDEFVSIATEAIASVVDGL